MLALELLLGLELPVELELALEPPLEHAATETAATDSAAAVVRTFFRTFALLKAGSMNRCLPRAPRRSGDGESGWGEGLAAPHGPAGVDEQGPPAAVIAEEDLREVEPVL